MKLFGKSKSCSKQIGPIRISSHKICSSTPLTIALKGLSIGKLRVRTLKTNVWDITLILRMP